MSQGQLRPWGGPIYHAHHRSPMPWPRGHLHLCLGWAVHFAHPFLDLIPEDLGF